MLEDPEIAYLYVLSCLWISDFFDVWRCWFWHEFSTKKRREMEELILIKFFFLSKTRNSTRVWVQSSYSYKCPYLSISSSRLGPMWKDEILFYQITAFIAQNLYVHKLLHLRIPICVFDWFVGKNETNLQLALFRNRALCKIQEPAEYCENSHISPICIWISSLTCMSLGLEEVTRRELESFLWRFIARQGELFAPGRWMGRKKWTLKGYRIASGTTLEHRVR